MRSAGGAVAPVESIKTLVELGDERGREIEATCAALRAAEEADTRSPHPRWPSRAGELGDHTLRSDELSSLKAFGVGGGVGACGCRGRRGNDISRARRRRRLDVAVAAVYVGLDSTKSTGRWERAQWHRPRRGWGWGRGDDGGWPHDGHTAPQGRTSSGFGHMGGAKWGADNGIRRRIAPVRPEGGDGLGWWKRTRGRGLGRRLAQTRARGEVHTELAAVDL